MNHALPAALATLLLLSFPPPSQAAAQPPELPPEVGQWLERDQRQRWARMLDIGEAKFAEGSCSKCHGAGGKGGRGGPNLTDTEWIQSSGDLAGIRGVIFWGVRRRDFSDPKRPWEMNPSGGMTLEWGEIDALAAYVWSLSQGSGLERRSP